jgi:putative peptidoglycan lipid II flippase
LVQIPFLGVVGMRWSPSWDWQDKAVRSVGRLMGPRVLGLGAYHFNFIIATFFASTLAVGAISALNYAWLIVMTPLGLFGMAIATAAFPRLAEEATRDEASLRELLSRSLRLILYLTIPASVGLMILAKPLTAFLLRGGAFDIESQDLVVGALVCYSLALFAHSGIEIISRGFYALSDTVTPVTFAVAAMVINLILSFVLVIPFEVNGLAIALSIATVVEFGLLLRAVIGRLGGLEGGHIIYSVTRTAMSTILMAEAVVLYLIVLNVIGLLDLNNRLDAGIALVGGAAIGTAVFFVASQLLHSDEADTLIERLPLPGPIRSLVAR